MYQFTINKKKLLMPMFGEVTMRQFLALQDAKTNQEQLVVMMGDDANYLPPGTQTANAIALAHGVVKDMEEWLNNQTPVQYVVMDKVIKLPDDIGSLPYWAITKAKDIIEEAAKEDDPDLFNRYPMYAHLVGHYIYTIVTGQEYNEIKAEQFCDDVIMELDFRQVILMGDFFLFRHKELWLTKQQSLKMNLMHWKRRLALKFSQNTETSTF